MSRLVCALALILVLCTTLPARAVYETGGVTKLILSNGVTLLVKPEPESKVAAVEILVRVGAQDEDVRVAGIGQLLAGSILAGTSRHSTTRLAQLVADAGGNFHSAWQWNYFETYAVTLPGSCEEAIGLLADAIQNSSLDPEAIEYSRKAVLKEIANQAGDPFASGYSAMRTSIYQGTRYGRPFLGQADVVKAITSAQVRAFYEKNFVADRVVVSVVGNVKPELVAHQVEVCFKNMDQTFGSRRKPDSAIPRSRQLVVEKSASSAYVMLGFAAPGVDGKDYTAMLIANVLLGENKSSLIFTRLREGLGLGYLVGSQYQPLLGTGSVVAYLGMDSSKATPEAVKIVETEMLAQVEALKSGKFSDDDLQRAKRYLIGKHALGRERTRDRAFYLGWAEVMGLGYQSDLPSSYADTVDKATREDVVRVANRFLIEPTTLVYAAKE